MIVIEHLTKRYGRTVVYADWSRTIGDGLTYLLGPNGSGKSTLLRCIAGYTAYHGRITVPRPIVYLPETRKFEEDWEVRDLFRFITELVHHPPPPAWARWAAALGIPPADWRQLKKLSKGTANKVYLLGPLLDPRPTILLDEPTDAFDMDAKAAFRALLEDLAPGRTVLVSTHDASLLNGTAPILRLP